MKIQLHPNNSLEVKALVYLDNTSVDVFLDKEIDVIVFDFEGWTLNSRRETFFPVWVCDGVTVEVINELDNK